MASARHVTRRGLFHLDRTTGLIILLALLGLGLRLILLVDAGWRYDYDEGMVGLHVLRILRGARPVFHPGQPYLGALESYLIAPVFAVFGANAITLKLVPWLLSGAYVGISGWLGWRAFDRQVAVLSALLAALAPVYLLITGMKTWGATAETLVLGGLMLVATSYVIDRTQPEHVQNRALIALGFLGGVAFWVSWLITFYAVPVVIVVLWAGRKPLRRRWWMAGLAFVAGNCPLWLYNVQHDFATFRHLLGDQDNGSGSIWDVLHHLNTDLAPRLVSGDPDWRLLSWPAIWWLQIVYQGGLVSLVIWARRGRWAAATRPARVLLALFACGLPCIYLLSDYSRYALNEFGFDATGRYVLMIHSVLPIGAAALCVGLIRWRRGLRLLAAAMLTSVIGLNLLGVVRMNPTQAFVSPYYTRQPATLEPLIDFLDEQGIRHVWTDVGIAHVLMFETGERILAADWYDIYGAKGVVRFWDVPHAIQKAGQVAFVEVILPGQTNTPFEQAFQRSGVPHAVVRVTPDILVIVPFGPIDPAVLGDGIGYQF
ncbi:MAG: hypothetical protein JW966_03280 [Anaerolineae bacterium]|nr:hypothetical protein [Anaerolineae bacterium]